MADKPILFSAPMVRALLAGIKTQTRRALNPQPHYFQVWQDEDTKAWRQSGHGEAGDDPVHLRIAVGDRLYVREAWRISRRYDATAPRDLEPQSMTVFFEAGGSISNNAHDHAGEIRWQPSSYGLSPENSGWIGRFRQGMHMPRWASRLTLTVADVRIERLQDISEADAIAEGFESIDAERFDDFDYSVCPKCGGTRLHGSLGANLGYMEVDCSDCDTHKKRYQHLWNHINGEGAWDANPWVAAYTFTVQHGNIDQIGEGAN